MNASAWVIVSWRRWILILVLVLVASGFLYEQISVARDRTELAQIGRSIDMGGRTLNIYCSGNGRPAVIFESGGTLPGYSWVFVQREVAKLTRSCWYDRAGYGWSDSRPEPNWSDLAAADLHELLSRADVRPPYVLVGHSVGGLNARVYQAMHPEDVVGMVLLDPADEAPGASGGSLANRLPNSIGWLLVYAARGLSDLGVIRAFAAPPGTARGGITQQEWNTIARLIVVAPAGEVERRAASRRAPGDSLQPAVLLAAARRASGSATRVARPDTVHQPWARRFSSRRSPGP